MLVIYLRAIMHRFQCLLQPQNTVLHKRLRHLLDILLVEGAHPRRVLNNLAVLFRRIPTLVEFEHLFI